MVYAVQGFFGFRNEARRDGVMQNVQTRLSTEVTWGETVTQAIPLGGRFIDPSMTVAVRFSDILARDAFWDDVIAFMGTGLNGPVTGSYIARHDCAHDELESGPCRASDRRDY